MHPRSSIRREFLLAMTRGGATLALAPLFAAGCGSTAISRTGVGASDANQMATGVASPDVSVDPNQTSEISGIDSAKWATGGTAAMQATASYPNPFSAPAAASCALTCQATAGPCYLTGAPAPTRQDISEGQDGLPMRLILRLLDTECTAVSGAKVELWHCSPMGLYSGQTPNPAFCSDSNASAVAAKWFRGTATSDAAGVVTFDSCFPGWYTSRTIHIHFIVTLTNNDTVTTQFFFPDAVCDGIVASQTPYKARGARDTNNQNDTVVSAAAAPDYCFDVMQMTDGAMLASKTLVLRRTTAETLCTIPSGAGGATGASRTAPGGPMPGSKLARPH